MTVSLWFSITYLLTKQSGKVYLIELFLQIILLLVHIGENWCFFIFVGGAVSLHHPVQIEEAGSDSVCHLTGTGSNGQHFHPFNVKGYARLEIWVISNKDQRF
jgi:hypothetical protein